MRSVSLEIVLVSLEWISFSDLKSRVVEVGHPEAIVKCKPVVIEHGHDLELRNDKTAVNMDTED
jgi:hypothetical protein